ncbi:MAG: hypothetical protein J5858_05750 [Lentisphaeria bacterium]|nr:hypothetical protein [Lentisphaeria bacterium]
MVGGIIFGFWSGHRLTLLVPFGEGGWNTLGKILVWLVLVGLCLCISGGIGLFGIFFPVLKVIHFCWEMICLFKDKCLKMSWCNNVVFGIAVYLIIPVLLLVGFLVTRSPQA